MLIQPFVIPSILIALVALPLVFRWIPRQSFYGVRTVKTLASDEIWYPVNCFAGVLMIMSSAIYIIVAWYLPDTTTVTAMGLGIWVIHLGAFIFPLIISLLIIRYYIRHL